MSVRQILAKLNHPLARIRNTVNPGARILMYHRVNDLGKYDQLTVTPTVFEQQAKWLAENRTVKSTGEIYKLIRSGEKKDKLVAITFDDGYLDNLENALPILEKYNLPATIYVTTDFADQQASHPRYTTGQNSNSANRLHLNWEEIRQLATHPLITIGSHTVTHPMLSELSKTKALNEISLSKERIEGNIQTPVVELCYPSGNFTWRESQMAEDSGYSCAVTVKPGINRKGADLFTLRRTEVTDKDQNGDFTMKMDGAFDIFHRLLDFRREVIFSGNRRSKKSD